ncbi:uncharacterized protein LOC126894490 [Daktulosphaira vitifoliae]|uniref:uncharacterized protein LOC126894490 n=1 Tax=Daktulosphaira vitifoliae TaxID=58002 RepID=UPI0021AAE523|nr:uncharacterized protein LOC126894490 [Daktulosphaira vitifoliae]
MKKYWVSMVVCALYGDMLNNFYYIYYDQFNMYMRQTPEAERADRKKKIIKSYVKFKPLLTCMASALKYFKCDYNNDMLDSFENILSNILLLENVNINKLKNISEWFKISFRVDDNIVVKTPYSVYYYVENLKNHVIMHLDPNDSVFENKVNNGIELLCESFGFPNK